MTTAYALAANGKHDAAREWVAVTRKALSRPIQMQIRVRRKKQKKARAVSVLFLPIVKTSSFDPMVSVIEARIAIAEARLPDAFASIKALQLRSTPVTKELYAADVSAQLSRRVNAPELPRWHRRYLSGKHALSAGKQSAHLAGIEKQADRL
ncbi:MAG: hypothetical protein IPM41_12405 [Sphingomonadales bacterium]|nr:hypothetical protein [Sphingomonadales bacterium]